jgi:glycosyltransferase involved in cell wall biosynthesis
LLAETLAGRGHEVLWWTSAIDHLRKRTIAGGEPRLLSKTGVQIQLLSGCLYRRNISVARLVNHVQLGRRFARLASKETRPDIILCSFPTIELSREAVRLGRQWGTPVILDVRDLWPDIFVDVLPRCMRAAGGFALRRQFEDTRRALADCSGLFAVSEGYLQWGLARGARQRGPGDAVYPLAYRLSDCTTEDEAALSARLRSCGLMPDEPIALFAGTFGRTYDLTTVIGAAKLLRARGLHRLQFALCGSGERLHEWQRTAAGVAGVAFTGWLPAGELSCLLRRATLGLAAYARGAPQGIPNKVVEYLAAGLPVLCSLQGESRDLLESEGCGVCYEAGDAQSLAAGIDRVLAGGNLMAMAARAQDVFERRFSAVAVYGEMAAHLERLAGIQRPGYQVRLERQTEMSAASAEMPRV